MQQWIRSKADEEAVKIGCYFDLAAAERVRDFFSKFLRHSKGEHATQPFELLQWQWEDIVCPVFGWKREDGTRRYRTAYIEIPKKNGKSTICAGIALYLLCADNEPGAEVYSAAGSRMQAAIVFDEAAKMVKQSPALQSRLLVKEFKKTIVFNKKDAKYEAISADAGTKEGLNVHGLIFDELHTQPNRKLWNTLRYGGAARRQPLTIVITTAGDDFSSLCWQEHVYAKAIIDGSITDHEYYGYIRAADPNDDILDPKTWYKANPSLGYTIPLANMESEARVAANKPSELAPFKRYRLNIWCNAAERWLDMDNWDSCPKNPPNIMPGDECFAAIDLSQTTDITALAIYFPAYNYVIPYFWCAQDVITKKAKLQINSYQVWVDQGLITPVKGAYVKYNVIRDKLLELREQYGVNKIVVDPWNATQFALDLRDNDNFDVEFYRQTYSHMSQPSKRFKELVDAYEFNHGDNQVLRWMASNVIVDEDSNKNIKPNKEQSKQSIDGIVCCIMAIGRSMGDLIRKNDDLKSPYHTRPEFHAI